MTVSTAKREWRGRHLRIVDTGGILPEIKISFPSEIFRQARVALDEADAIIMVVDGRTELAAPDLELARLLISTGKPLFLAVNKIDTDKQAVADGRLSSAWNTEVFPISAEHGTRHRTICWMRVWKFCRRSTPIHHRRHGRDHRGIEQDEVERDERTDDSRRIPSEVKVAIIGHPNVGKSTLLNRLTGTDRAIVSPIPGTTRDAVDEIVERDGQRFRFIDTAGIRRKGKTHLMAEKLSVVMARKHLEDADIALLVIDATEGVSQLDATIAGYAHESGRSMIIVVNKWDLVISGKKRARPADESRAHAGEQAPGGSRSLRRTPARRAEISQLCARVVRLGLQRAKAPTRFSRCSKRSPASAASASEPAR